MPVYVGRILTAFFLIAISIYIWIASEEFPANGHQVPQFTSGVAIFLSLILLFNAFRNKKNNADKINFEFNFASKKQFVILLLAIVYVPAIFTVGYFTSSFFLLVLGSLIVGVRNFKSIAITVVISLPLMYLFFELFLHAQLPRGWLV